MSANKSTANAASNNIKRLFDEKGNFLAVHVRVYFFDERERVLQLKERNPTALNVFKQLSEKEGLNRKSRRLFSLWMVGTNLELRLRPQMTLLGAVKKWRRWTEKYTHIKDSKFRFYFKREALLDRDMEAALLDEKSCVLLSGEARKNVMNGRYLCTPYEAIQFASLSLQSGSGDFTPGRYMRGSYVDSLSNLIPAHMMKLMKPIEWEDRIVEEYKSCAGLSPHECHSKLLAMASEWTYYGCIFFPACITTPPDGYFERREEFLLIGVNADGIHVIDEERSKLLISESYETLAWEKRTSSILVEYGPEDDPIVQTFITPQFELIDNLAGKAVEALETLEEMRQQNRAYPYSGSNSNQASSPRANVSTAGNSPRSPQMDPIQNRQSKSLQR